MSLDKYSEKRDFSQTEEPEGILENSKDQLVFVVQKHQASHLHYDFRLEMDGVLKSWAIPKGPSLDPELKRLAVFVEDHPYGYKDFEGSIPKGNYGAGNVIVWDQGSFTSSESKSLEEDENVLLKGLKKGHLSFNLQGEKLKGHFSLIKLKGKQDNAWLLVKKDDEYATSIDILKKDRSVLSGLTLEALAEKHSQKITAKENNKQEIEETNKSVVSFQSPMLATISQKAFDNEDWLFEKKYDGYRILAVSTNKKVSL